jgi:hypothetical protein
MHQVTIPTVAAELERKLVEFLLSLQEPDVEPAHAVLQCRALWTVTAGLVDSALSTALSDHTKGADSVAVREFFIGNGHVLILAFFASSRKSGFTLVNINTTTNARTILRRVTCESGDLFAPGERATLLDGVRQALSAKGYVKY